MVLPLPADESEPTREPIAGQTLLQLADALADVDETCVLSHRSAAAVWGLWIPDFDGVEVTTPAGERGSRYTTGVQSRAITAHRRLLATNDRTVHHGLPVTSLARTWLDLASMLSVHDLVAAGDSALRAGVLSDELFAQLARSQRLRGVRRAREAIGLLDERSRSRPESRIRAALLLAGLPRPRVNEPVYDQHGGWLAEPDLHYREARVALEYNGAVHATVERMRKDSTRLLCLQRDDWAVRTYTATHAFVRLDEVVADVTGLLAARAPELLARARLSRRVTYLQDQRRRKRRL